jgi:catechol 2,3-dioxygenase-like lactoylglutathione lyase family enzyme
MLANAPVFSSYSTNDVDACLRFYRDTLGVEVSEAMGGLGLRFANGQRIFIYPKPNHEPATFTVLNFPVDDVDATVDRLTTAGIAFERYPGMEQDEKGIVRGDAKGPDIAWFKDPTGNIIAVLKGDGEMDR